MTPGTAPGRLGSEIHSVARGRTATHRHLRERLMALALITLVVDLVGSALIYVFEHAAKSSGKIVQIPAKR